MTPAILTSPRRLAPGEPGDVFLAELLDPETPEAGWGRVAATVVGGRVVYRLADVALEEQVG